jgi:hypothetical protein
MPRPSTLPTNEPPICGPSAVGGWRFSKLSRRRASRTAAGVLGPPATGVRFHDAPTCAGLGDMLRNSAKFRFVDGVARPKPVYAAPPPGVDIIEDGSGVCFGGGVEGAGMCLADPGRAGVGDVARYMSRLASSSPVLPSRAAPAALKPLCRRRAERATSGGGVRGARGGDSRRCER